MSAISPPLAALSVLELRAVLNSVDKFVMKLVLRSSIRASSIALSCSFVHGSSATGNAFYPVLLNTAVACPNFAAGNSMLIA
jgi:hypothetical protein